MVRKRAAYDYSLKGAAEYGTFDSNRLEGDVTGSLNNDGSIRGRFIAFGHDKDSFIDISHRLRYGGYGTLQQLLAKPCICLKCWIILNM